MKPALMLCSAILLVPLASWQAAEAPKPAQPDIIMYEGALRQAAIARWPGTIPAGRVSDEPWAFWDFLAHVTCRKRAAQQEDQTMKRRPGIVALPILLAFVATLHAAESHRRAEKPNIVVILADDIGEQKNLAATKPEKVKELRATLDAVMKTAVPAGEGSTPMQKIE